MYARACIYQRACVKEGKALSAGESEGGRRKRPGGYSVEGTGGPLRRNAEQV